MTIEGTRKRATLCLAVILLVLSLCARTTESFRLKKTERRDRRREAAAGFQPGRILFGNVFEKRSSVDAQAGDGGHISTAASAEVGEDANYQGDSPACTLLDLQTQVPPEMKPMSPSVLCGLDKMKFMLQGADVPQLALDPGPAAPPVPLSNIPPTCGYNVQRNPSSLVMMAPYNDCFMIQEGAYYVLPMRWQDTHFSLWCPMHSMSQPTAPPTPSPSQMPQFQPQYFLPPWFLPSGVAPPAQQPPGPPGQSPQIPPGQSPQIPPGQSPQIPPGQSPQIPPGQHPQIPQIPPGQSPQIPPGQHPQSPQIPQFPPWYPYPVTAPPAQVPSMTTSPQTTASKTGSQQLFDPHLYPMPLSFYPPTLPWGGLLYPPVAEPPVKSKANQQPPRMPAYGYSYYPYNFPPIFNPFPQPQPKQPPPKVLPYFPPFGQFPIKVFRYPVT